MSKQVPFLVFLVLISAIAFFIGKNKDIISSLPFLAQSASATPAPAASLPLAIDSPAVTAAYAHYYVSGKIMEIRDSQDTKQLVLDSEEQNLPELFISQTTVIARISPPYDLAKAQNIKLQELTAGMTVDVYLEYDLRAKTWKVPYVYVPADRN